MTEDYGAGVVRRFWEKIFGEGDIKAMDEVFASNFKLHDLVYWEIQRLEDVERIVRETHYAMPGIRVVVEDQRVTSDDEVFTHFTIHVPLPQDSEAAGQRARPKAEKKYSGMSLSRVVDGKIEESRLVWEALRASVELESAFGVTNWRWPPWK